MPSAAPALADSISDPSTASGASSLKASMSSPSLSADAVQTQSTPAPAPAGTTTTTIAYDMAGRHLREKVVRTNQAFEDNPSLKGTEVFQDNHLSYDTLGRLVSSADDSTLINFDYDKAGNRTRVRITSFVPGVNHPDSETPTYVSRYFLYDAMNRQTVVDGLNADGDISSAQGHKLTYDLNGNRRTDVFYGNHVTGTLSVYDHNNVSGGTIYHAGSLGHTTALVTETYAYDGLDRLQKTTRDGIEVDSRFYDEASRLLQSGPTGLPTDYGEEVNEGVAPEEQTGTEIRRMRYDVDGRLLFERARKSDDSSGVYDVDYEGTSGHDHRQLGYDGNAIAYDTTIYDGGIDYLANVSLARFEGYVQKSETHTDLHGDQTGTTSSRYDANGLLVSLDDSTEDSLDRGFVNDADGHILRTRQGGNDLWSTVVSGEVLGRHGVGMDPADERTDHGAANLAQVSDFGFGYRHISGSYPKAGVGSYTIRQGDSLQSVAQAAFGDSKLWWKVAEANGVSGNTDLKVGQTLKLPNLVEGQSNDSGTFKPYDPSDAVGDTSPNLPMPHHGEACGGFGQIIMIVVAVAVTVYTAGLLSGADGALVSTLEAEGEALGGETASFSIADAAVAGAAGSVASQAVGNAIGAEHGFDWKQVALSAVSAGATQGAGQVLANAGVSANVAAKAALANALTQGVGLATGLEDRFEWKAVAASAASAAVREAVGDEVGGAVKDQFDSRFAQKLVTGTAAGIAAGATASLMRAGRVQMVQLAADAFGNALGDSVVDQMSEYNLPSPATADEKATIIQSFQDDAPAETPSHDWLSGMKLRLRLQSRPDIGMEDGSYLPRPVLLASNSSGAVDERFIYGDALLMTDRIITSPDDSALVDVLAKTLQNPKIPVRPRLLLDDFGNIVGQTVTIQQLQAVMPNAGLQADVFVGPLNDAMERHVITTPEQQAAFLSQIAHESNQLRSLEENLNYSTARLTEIWPSRFPNLQAAQPFSNNSEGLGNYVYANRLGNGDASSGDGFNYRGSGFIQVTGRANYAELGFEDQPQFLREPKGAASSAAEFWSRRDLNDATTHELTRQEFDQVTKIVNGGLNGADNRWNFYQRAVDAIIRSQWRNQ